MRHTECRLCSEHPFGWLRPFTCPVVALFSACDLQAASVDSLPVTDRINRKEHPTHHVVQRCSFRTQSKTAEALSTPAALTPPSRYLLRDADSGMPSYVSDVGGRLLHSDAARHGKRWRCDAARHRGARWWVRHVCCWRRVLRGRIKHQPLVPRRRRHLGRVFVLDRVAIFIEGGVYSRAGRQGVGAVLREDGAARVANVRRRRCAEGTTTRGTCSAHTWSSEQSALSFIDHVACYHRPEYVHSCQVIVQL
jgi:hypothetical protein